MNNFDQSGTGLNITVSAFRDTDLSRFYFEEAFFTIKEGRKEREDIANEVRAIEVAEDCNHFVRLVMDYLVEPRGMRRPNVEGAPARRGWAKRNQKLIEAHCQWVDVDSRYAYAYHSACVKRAQAAYKLFVFALGCWRIPEHIAVPRAAQLKPDQKAVRLCS